MHTVVLNTNYNCINIHCTEQTHPTYSYVNILYLECQWAEIHLYGVTYSIRVCHKAIESHNSMYPTHVGYQFYKKNWASRVHCTSYLQQCHTQCYICI